MKVNRIFPWARLAVAWAALGASLSCPEWAVAQTYLVADLGTLGGTNSGALSLNNAGTVVGFAATLTGLNHAVILSNNILSDLGTLGGTNNSVGNDINQLGDVVGWANKGESLAQRAFFYSGEVMTDLGALLVDSTNSVARGVNSAGTVVGEYRTSSGRQRPFLYANGIALDLGFDGAATCINELGQIGGYERNRGVLGFILSGGQRRYMGTLGGSDTEVARLNTNGVAVGRSMSLQGTFHGFLYEDGKMIDLGTLGGPRSEAYGVNNGGHVVGKAQDRQGVYRAFIYRKGAIYDLNTFLTPGTEWFLETALSINDPGLIVGLGKIKGQTHGFLLIPNFIEMAVYPGLTVTGTIGRKYRVDYVDAISPTNSWQVLTNFVLPASPYLFVDPRPVVLANRVYRLVLLP